MLYDLAWVIAKYDLGEPMKYVFFWGHAPSGAQQMGKFIFSQWYPSAFIVEGVTYKTAEHWMMAKKAQLFGASSLATQILNAEKPGEAKELGRRVENFNEAKWNAVKFQVVVEGNWHKFSQNSELKNYLLDTTGRILVEASPTDTVWGIGLPANATKVENPHTWRGQNLLGFALMEVRDLFRLTKQP